MTFGRFVSRAVLLLVFLSIATQRGAISETFAQSRPKRATVIVDTVKPADIGSAQFVMAYGLTREDYGLLTRISTIASAVPIREVPAEAWYWDRFVDVRLIGTNEEYAAISKVELGRGRFLTVRDNVARHNVAVIDQGVADRLFRKADPIGKSVLISRNYFLVVGVTKDVPRKPSGLGNLSDDAAGDILIPVSTMTSFLGDLVQIRTPKTSEFHQVELTRIVLALKEEAQADRTGALVERLLRRRHETEDYSIRLEDSTP
jgi:putative ABC transport system permease protein